MKNIFLILLMLVSLNAESDLGIQEKLGEYVPLDITFFDENNKTVTLKKMMAGKPTIITLNYFRCAGICTPQLDELAKTLDKLDLSENTDYKVLTMSFAENETPPLAAAKRKTHLASMGRPFVQDAWHFLISDGNSTAVLADYVGFKYEKVVNHVGKVDYLHPAALIILSPEGKITRYLNGVDQLPFDVKMALLEASEGKVGPTIAKGLLFCFEYDAQGKKYIFVWEKVAATVMLTIVFGFFIYLIRLGRKEDDRHNDKPEPREKKD
ncbi:SCO family protein [Sulfurimonas sp. MAG313]|nr:SCO family protein [Sulfurimonas sp. MAG313]MDF1880552.1 SCO family protein [Sulfurimonas sp. MAG313]